MVLQDSNIMSPKMICGFDPEKEKCRFIDFEIARLRLSYKSASLFSVLCCISTNELWQKVKNRHCTHKIDLKAPNSHSSAQCCNTIGYLRMRKTSTVCRSIWLSDRKKIHKKDYCIFHYLVFMAVQCSPIHVIFSAVCTGIGWEIVFKKAV